MAPWADTPTPKQHRSSRQPCQRSQSSNSTGANGLGRRSIGRLGLQVCAQTTIDPLQLLNPPLPLQSLVQALPLAPVMPGTCLLASPAQVLALARFRIRRTTPLVSIGHLHMPSLSLNALLKPQARARGPTRMVATPLTCRLALPAEVLALARPQALNTTNEHLRARPLVSSARVQALQHARVPNTTNERTRTRPLVSSARAQILQHARRIT